MRHTLFISDLHLSPDNTVLTDCFYSFLSGLSNQVDALYILGDLFEYWLGDDAMMPWHHEIAAAISKIAKSGIKVFFMPGNRDFLVGQAFCVQAQAIYLSDPTIISLYGEKTLIKHGDDLCSLDKSHQRFRKFSRLAWTKRLFLRLPLNWRLSIANRLRNPKLKSRKTMKMMDVVQACVDDAFSKYDVDCLIHGHTHRPLLHLYRNGDKIRSHIVLSDWSDLPKMLKFNTDLSYRLV